MSPNEPNSIDWTLDDARIAWISFDLPGEKVNKLSTAVAARLSEVLDELEGRTDVEGAVIESKKDGVFLAGADVAEFQNIEDRDAAFEAIRAGQRLMDRVEALPFPVVAAISGICLGGGTEMALACDGRLATDHPKCRIGLPEVNLGILPAWGGTTRLPRLIGLPRATDFILRGRPVDAKRAKKLGLVDDAVATGELRARARALVRDLVDGRPPRRPGPSLGERLLSGNPIGRAVFFSQARKRVMSQTSGHYPAPLAILDVLREGRVSKARSLELEAERAAELLIGDVSRNLVRLFFLSEAAKRGPGVDPDAEASEVGSAAVLGAGTMGGGIARLLAARDIAVRLKDVNPDALGAGLAAARKIFDGAKKRRRMTSWELERRMALITPTLDWTGFRRTDAVIEAIIEDMSIKKTVLAELESHVSGECLIATNTSTLSVTEMQEALERPERMAGFHFFNPVDRMPLVEVIRGRHTSEPTMASLVALAKKLGKTPVVVNDGPGFLVNRILGPYLNEAGHLLTECGDIEGIDRAYVAFGMPMGPLRLLDEIGLDVAQKAGRVLAEAFGERAQPSPVVDRLVAEGRLGKKSGRGFYVHSGDGKGKAAPDATVLALLGVDRRPARGSEILERGLSLMIAEATRCLDDDTTGSAGELDLAMIMGTGFPPFRGGLLRYADSWGTDAVVERLATFRERLGIRFESPEGLTSERRFYPPRV